MTGAQSEQLLPPRPGDVEYGAFVSAIDGQLTLEVALSALLGFTGVTPSTDHEVLVYWVGEVPEQAREIVRRSDGPVVRFVESAYTAEEVDAAIQEGVSAASRMTDVNSLALAPAVDFSGLAAGVESGSGLSGQSDEELTASLGIDVPIVEQWEVPAARDVNETGLFSGARRDDTGSLDGGALIFIGDGTCTAGVSAFDTQRNNRRVMLTAAHCFGTGSAVAAPSGARGVLRETNQARDVAFFDSAAEGYSSWQWSGGPNATNRIANGATTRPQTGEAGLCMSGAGSGSLCDVSIHTPRLSLTFGGIIYQDLILARRLLVGGAAGAGDSGAPLIRKIGSRGRAMGTVTGPLDQAPFNSTNCVGYATLCNSYVYFGGIRDAELAMGFEVINP